MYLYLHQKHYQSQIFFWTVLQTLRGTTSTSFTTTSMQTSCGTLRQSSWFVTTISYFSNDLHTSSLHPDLKSTVFPLTHSSFPYGPTVHSGQAHSSWVFATSLLVGTVVHFCTNLVSHSNFFTSFSITSYKRRFVIITILTKCTHMYGFALLFVNNQAGSRRGSGRIILDWEDQN